MDATPGRTLHPWERQPYDTDESWPIFVAYRDQTLPRRGLLVLCKGRPVDPIRVAWYHKEHYWPERVAEYDRHLDAIRRAEREGLLAQTIREVTAEHAEVLADARDIVRRELEKLLATVRESAGEVVRVRDLIRLTELVIKSDRLIRGESTENVDTGPDLSHLTNEQLTQIEGMLAGESDADVTKH